MKKLLALLPAVLLACADSPTAPPSPAPLKAPTATSNGAVVVHDKIQDTYCFEDPAYNYRYCSTVDGQFHQTETPSGNTIFFWHADYTWETQYSYGGYTYEDSGEQSFKQHFVLKPGEDQVVSWKDKGEYSYTVNGQTVTCTWSNRFHYANGEVRNEGYEYNCTDPTSP